MLCSGNSSQRCVTVQFMEMARPPEEYILVLDSDMLIHKPFLPSNFEVAKGTAASENM